MKITKAKLIGGSLLTAALLAMGGMPAMADDTTTTDPVTTDPSVAQVIVEAPMAPAPNTGFFTGYVAPSYGPALAYGSTWAVYSPYQVPLVDGSWDTTEPAPYIGTDVSVDADTSVVVAP